MARRSTIASTVSNLSPISITATLTRIADLRHASYSNGPSDTLVVQYSVWVLLVSALRACSHLQSRGPAFRSGRIAVTQRREGKSMLRVGLSVEVLPLDTALMISIYEMAMLCDVGCWQGVDQHIEYHLRPGSA